MEPSKSRGDLPVVVAADVARAVDRGEAVVALETAVLTHGLPREPWSTLAKRWKRLGSAPEWVPPGMLVNLAAVRAMSDAVRAAGAVPAVTAVIAGKARVGLGEAEVAALASDHSARKVARRDLAPAMAAGASGGTTVSASLALARMVGVRVFATGGIGGVHRGWQRTPDFSADLESLAREQVCVVSSGAKSILDLPATIEVLETLSVPVIGFRCDAFPRFINRADPTLRVQARVDDEHSIASIARTHWSLGGSALLVVQPVDAAAAIDDEPVFNESAETADTAATPARPGGSPRGAGATPHLLARVAEATEGASLRANLLLLRANAALAARIALALAST